MADVIIEFLIVTIIYVLVSYCQAKFSKKYKKDFSIQETLEEAWIICLVIALAIVITNHTFRF